MNEKRNCVRNCIVFFAVVCVIAGLVCLLGVTQKVEIVTIEAGQPLEMDPANYFSASKFARHFIKASSVLPDTKLVQHTKVNYFLYGLFQKKVYVDIVDTTPPNIELRESELGFATGKEIIAKDLLRTCEDNAYGTVLVTFENGQEQITYEENGVYEQTIYATDDYGNVSAVQLSIHIATPPSIVSPTDFYIVKNAKDANMDTIRNYISAVDEKEGVLPNDCLTIKQAEFDFTKEGDYSVNIWAKNHSLVKSVKQIQIHIAEESQMTQAMLERADTLLTSVVIDDDYGLTTPYIMNGDSELAEKFAKKNSVSIWYNLGNGTVAYGNGVILDLTEKELYIASNYHVLGEYADYQAELMFSNAFKTSDYTYLGGNKELDIAFLKVDLDALDEETKAFVMEPRLSLARAKTVQSGEKIFRHSIYQNKSAQTTSGSFQTYSVKIFTGVPYSAFDVAMKQGDSGSGIYDAHGYLISLCSGIAHESGREIKCGVRMEDIISEFERVTGQKLYAY